MRRDELEVVVVCCWMFAAGAESPGGSRHIRDDERRQKMDRRTDGGRKVKWESMRRATVWEAKCKRAEDGACWGPQNGPIKSCLLSFKCFL